MTPSMAGRPGRMIARRWRGPLGVALLALSVAGCGAGAGIVGTPTPSPSPLASLDPALASARAQVVAALGAASIEVQDAKVAYRPAEGALMREAPRTVIQAVIPAAPDGGFIVLYGFADPAAAIRGASDDATYIASGPGRVQFPNDARFTIRQLGSVVVFHAYSPAVSPAPQVEAAIATALATVGTGYAVSP